MGKGVVGGVQKCKSERCSCAKVQKWGEPFQVAGGGPGWQVAGEGRCIKQRETGNRNGCWGASGRVERPAQPRLTKGGQPCQAAAGRPRVGAWLGRALLS